MFNFHLAKNVLLVFIGLIFSAPTMSGHEAPCIESSTTNTGRCAAYNRMESAVSGPTLSSLQVPFGVLEF